MTICRCTDVLRPIHQNRSTAAEFELLFSRADSGQLSR